MDHLFSAREQSLSTLQRRILTALGAAATVAILWRDLNRRRAGLGRRSPTQVLAAVLGVLGPSGRRAGEFLMRHHVTAYAAMAVGLYLLFKYQQVVRRFLRRLLRDNPTPADALSSDYAVAGEDGDSIPEAGADSSEAGPSPAAAATPLFAPSEAMRLLRGGEAGSESDAREAERARGLDEEDDDEDGAEVEAAFRAAYAAAAEAAKAVAAKASPEAADAPSGLRMSPSVLQQPPPSMAYLAQFLRMMRHTVQGISTRAVLALYTRLERVSLRRGEVLFRAGDASDSGMYIILKGSLGVHAPCAPGPHGYSQAAPTASVTVSPNTPELFGPVLCSFGVAQTLGENALLSCTAPHGASPPADGDAAAPPEGPSSTTRPVTAVAQSACTLLRLPLSVFAWFTREHPDALTSFVLTTTARQWRVAYYLLVEFMRLQDAWLAALEPPGAAPAFRLVSPAKHAPTPLVAAAAPSPIGGHGAPPFSSPVADVPESPLPPATDGRTGSGGGGGGVPMYVAALRAASSAVLLKQPGDIVYREGVDADALYIILSGVAVAHVADAPHVLGPVVYAHDAAAASASAAADAASAAASDAGSGEDALPPDLGHVVRYVRAGCISGGHACFVGLPHRETLTAVTQLEVAVVTRRMFSLLAEADPSALHVGRSPTLLQIALAIGRSLVPLLRMFLSLGLQRLWLRSGQTLFSAGDRQDGLYVCISGRLRTQTSVRRRTRVLDTRPTVETPVGDGTRSSPGGATSLDYDDSDEESYSTDDFDDGGNVGAARHSRHLPCIEAAAAPKPSFSVSGASPLASQARQKHLRFADDVELLSEEKKSSRQAAVPVVSPLAQLPQRRASTARPDQGGSIRVDVGRGETVGELAVLVRARVRTSTAVCVRDCELVRISQAGFALIAEKYPSVTMNFAHVLARRYDALLRSLAGGGPRPRQRGMATAGGFLGVRNTVQMPRAPTSAAFDSQQKHGLAGILRAASTGALQPASTSAPSYVTIAIVPAGARPPQLADFTARLVAALQRLDGPVLHLTSAKIDLILGDGTTSHLSTLYVRAKLGAWLSAQEERYRFIVFESDTATHSFGNGAQTDDDTSSGSRTYTDLAKTMARNVRDRVQTIGRNLDSAVRSGIGVSPSMVFSGLAGASSQSQSLHQRTAPVSTVPTAAASAWTRMCVQQADLCLLVGVSHTPPGLSATEQATVYRAAALSSPSPGASPVVSSPVAGRAGVAGVAGSPADTGTPDSSDVQVRPAPADAAYMPRTLARKELVLLHHDSHRRPQGTRNWLRPRRVAWWHHIRTWADEFDFDRLARHICGQSRAVVLSGGGSRGLAHLGVLATLEKRGLGVDVIGGTSQGAFMGGCYAMTLSSSACVPIVQRFSRAMGDPWNLALALTLPLVSYFSGASFNEALIDCFSGTQIEDLWIRYFCVSTNVTDDRLEVHTAGPLWRYVRASMGLLGLLPPFYDHGRLLIDGGYTDNIPVEVMRAIAPAAAQIVISDVENKDNALFEGVDNYGDSLSGWWVAWKWALGVLRLSAPLKIPPISEVALKVSYISHTMLLRELINGADDSIVYVRPDISRFKLLDYHLMEKIVETGAAAARVVLDRTDARAARRVSRRMRRVGTRSLLGQGVGPQIPPSSPLAVRNHQSWLAQNHPKESSSAVSFSEAGTSMLVPPLPVSPARGDVPTSIGAGKPEAPERIAARPLSGSVDGPGGVFTIGDAGASPRASDN